MEWSWDIDYVAANELSNDYLYQSTPEDLMFEQPAAQSDGDRSKTPTGSTYASIDLSPLSAQLQYEFFSPVSNPGDGNMNMDSGCTDIDLESLTTSPSSSIQDYSFVIRMPLSASQAENQQSYNSNIDHNAVSIDSSTRNFHVLQPERFMYTGPVSQTGAHTAAQSPITNCPPYQDVSKKGLLYDNLQDLVQSNTVAFADQSPCNDPWSSEGQQRYPHTAHADVLLFGPESDPMESMYSIETYDGSSPPTFVFHDSPSFAETSSAPQSILAMSPPITEDVQAPALDFHSSTTPTEPMLAIDIAYDALHTVGLSHSLTGAQARPMQSPNPQRDIYSYGVPQSVTLTGANPGQFIPKLERPTSNRTTPTETALTSPSPSRTSRFVHVTMDTAAHDLGVESQSQRSRGKSAGGRRPGSHLVPDKAAKIKKMRDEVACWQCCLQRDECTPGSVCDRCQKRSLRPQSDNGLGCDRTKLMDLTEYFLPALMTRIHKLDELKAFGSEHIQQWSSIPIHVNFECGHGLPPLPCEVYEFKAKTHELLRQFQYVENPQTKKMERQEWACPPLAMMQIDQPDRRRYEAYLNEITDHHMLQFAHLCFDDESNDFQTRLLLLMCNLEPGPKDEAQLLRNVFRLVVASYIMGRKFIISEESKEQSLRKLFGLQTRVYGEHCSPRMANRQLKYLFCALHWSIMQDVLQKLQQILRSSKGCGKWLSAFVAILGLAMVHEETQKTAHIIADSNYAQGIWTERQAEREAGKACQIIDDRFFFITNLFRWKYNRGFNPFNRLKPEKVTEVLGVKAMGFVSRMHHLVSEKFEYLHHRRYVSISTDNQERYTSRLVGRFLLSFLDPLTA